MSKKSSKRKKSNKGVYLVLGIILAILLGISINIKIEEEKYSATIEYTPVELPAYITDDQGEVVEEDEIPTVEEVDGGKFEDEFTGVSATEGEYEDLGWAEYYNTSSPNAFRNDTIGKCVYANNRYGAQCVSLARVFWWSYANRDVSTCGTGMAKGMMNCADQNAGNDFVVYWKESYNDIQAGDWLIFDGGQYGHVGMALGPVTNGYVTLLGENQGGKACERGGAATNIINISIKNLIGFYRPKAYIKPDPAPTPAPTPTPEPRESYTVKKGDTLGGIARKLGWYTGKELFGDNGYAQKLAEFNGIANRGLIYPGQVIFKK